MGSILHTRELQPTDYEYDKLCSFMGWLINDTKRIKNIKVAVFVEYEGE